jgi:hypothetical protein
MNRDSIHFRFFNKVCLRARELLAHEPRVPWWGCHLEAQALAFTLMFVFIRKEEHFLSSLIVYTSDIPPVFGRH